MSLPAYPAQGETIRKRVAQRLPARGIHVAHGTQPLLPLGALCHSCENRAEPPSTARGPPPAHRQQERQNESQSCSSLPPWCWWP